MNDKDILSHIKGLVDEEQKLYSQDLLADSEKTKLNKIETELDQYWDLLRQRRALREFGQNPEQAKLRGTDTVENYEQ